MEMHSVFFHINEKNSQEIRYVLSNQTWQCYTSTTARENVKKEKKVKSQSGYLQSALLLAHNRIAA